jgi:hypothetical protein
MILSFLVQCVGPQVAREEEKAEVRDRVNEYWQHKIKGNIEKAYQCELPAYREKVSILQYANHFRMFRYLDAEVQDIEVKGREANSKVRLTYVVALKVISQKKLNRSVEEKWINIEGTWYHMPEGFETKKDDSKGQAEGIGEIAETRIIAGSKAKAK